jgi:hypothetical protein
LTTSIVAVAFRGNWHKSVMCTFREMLDYRMTPARMLVAVQIFLLAALSGLSSASAFSHPTHLIPTQCTTISGQTPDKSEPGLPPTHDHQSDCCVFNSARCDFLVRIPSSFEFWPDIEANDQAPDICLLPGSEEDPERVSRGPRAPPSS